jgi:opacity protein-like surface antigen
VDYITFDTVNNVVIPTYYTHNVEVWDTVNHYSVTETKANYTYLEIPLLFGYRYSFGKFSIFAKAGPSASFLIYKNIPETGYPEDKARIINEHYQIPARNTICWQLMMGTGFDYQLADKISFSLEPTFRYALKPEYKLPDGARGNTTSFGIRAGLNYNF